MSSGTETAPPSARREGFRGVAKNGPSLGGVKFNKMDEIISKGTFCTGY